MTILDTLVKQDLLIIFDLAKKYYNDEAIKEDDNKIHVVRSYIKALENVLNSKQRKENVSKD